MHQMVFTFYEAGLSNPEFRKLSVLQRDVLEKLLHQAKTPEQASSLASEIIQRWIGSLLDTNWEYWFKLYNETKDEWVDIKENEEVTCSRCRRTVRRKDRLNLSYDGGHPNSKSKHYISCCKYCLDEVKDERIRICSYCGQEYAMANDHDHKHAGLCRDCRSGGDESLIREWHRLQNNLFRAKGAGTEATLTLRQWIDTIEHFGGFCAYCQQEPFYDMEHFIAIDNGGGTTAQNCVPSCRKCNLEKKYRLDNKLDQLAFWEHEPYRQVQVYLKELTHSVLFDEDRR